MTLADLHDRNKGFIVKDACIVGVEVFVCMSSQEKPMNQAASLTFGSQTGLIDVEVPRPKSEAKVGDMEDKLSSVEKFTWKVENFSCFNKEIYSKPFVLGSYPWKFLLYQWGDNVGDLSIFLRAVQTANMSKGWCRHVKFKLIVFNQFDSNRTITSDEIEQKFTASANGWGIQSLVSSTVLHDPQSGFLVKDVCIIGVEVSFHPTKYEKPVSHAAMVTKNLEVEVIKPMLEEHQGQNAGELKDLKGLGQIEKAFIPLLEKLCSMYPSLIDCQQKRSLKFREWAFTALGRVLYFLKTRKVKDMNDLACKDLQIFWEELQSFDFELTWLEPHVQSALGMKNYLEKVKKVDKLKHNVVTLEMEKEKLKAKLAIVDVNLDVARDLLIAENLEELDLDAELGFIKL
ncbi:hypothetical protein TSUD_272360 [Trifolium subterraneum]|uniref:MATH domain-containing protein n=1 Tax=Trifolium subterraneum TaxID=3900 RepID=A0A2Z6NUX7_TRISU|nr:hypothetical protein TSUD_272360 [Trifolium subterraneum]